MNTKGNTNPLEILADYFLKISANNIFKIYFNFYATSFSSTLLPQSIAYLFSSNF